MVKKMYQKLESFWGTTGRPVLTFFITVIVLCTSVSVSVLACSFLDKQMNPTYFDAVKGKLPKQAILQDENNTLYVADLKKETLTPLEVESQQIVLADTGEVYGVTFHSKNIQVDLLSVNKKGAIEQTTYSVDYQVSSPEAVEIIIKDSVFYFLDKATNELVYFTLANRVNLSTVVLDVTPMSWAINENTVYYCDGKTIYWYDLIHSASGEVLTMNNISGLLISGDELIFSEKEDGIGFITSYSLKDKEISHSIAMIEAVDVRVIPSWSQVPYFYLYSINSLGGIQLEMINDDLEKSHLFNHKDAVEAIETLKFIDGYAYFINDEKQGVIVVSEGKSISLGETIKNILPFY